MHFIMLSKIVQEHILLTWINFNTSMYINNQTPSNVWDEITYPIAMMS